MTTGKKRENNVKRGRQIKAGKQSGPGPKGQGTAQQQAEKLGCYGPSYQALELLSVLHEYGAFNAADAYPAHLLGESLGLCPEHLVELSQSIFCSRFAVVLVTTYRRGEEELEGLFIETHPEAVAAMLAWRSGRSNPDGEAARRGAGSNRTTAARERALDAKAVAGA
jgi:hypothetical protein